MQREHANGWLLLLLALALSSTSCSHESKPKLAACDQGSVCRDSDCDTLCDIDEGGQSVDTDGDGTPDYLDTDSDGDGIPDQEEAGDADPKTPPYDRDLNGVADYLDRDFPLGAGQSHPDASVPAGPPPDASTLDGSGLYGPDSGEILSELCPDDAIIAPACLANESNLCNGLDDDCDGDLDGDGSALCDCVRGEVRRCFRGPPGRRGIGSCHDGTQVCVGDEFSHWGPCSGGKAPSAEACNGLDDDCNGCADEIAGCKPALGCPRPNDPRTPDAKPFTPYPLDASLFYQGADALSYQWEIRGSPCDRMFGKLDPKATSTSGKLSYTLSNAQAKNAQVTFTLSGSYEVTLRIMTSSGELRCSWVVQVRAPGVRVELCWDKTGPSAKQHGDAVDLDLHLGRKGTTAKWFDSHDCYWDSCRGEGSPFGYGNTTSLAECTGAGAQNYAAYTVLGFCPNPRLDADNRLDERSEAAYIAENINLDAPHDGDELRVMVHYETNVPTDAQGVDAGAGVVIAVHPIVNVYCDGELQGSFGGDPEALGDSEELSGFSTSGQMWRVVDIAVAGQGCKLTPLSAPTPDSGYFITPLDPSYDGN